MVPNEGYEVRLTVMEEKGQEGSCDFGHKVGDVIVFHPRKVEGEICPSVLATVIPAVHAMRWGAEFPWSEDKDVDLYACPDPRSPLLFEIRRVRK